MAAVGVDAAALGIEDLRVDGERGALAGGRLRPEDGERGQRALQQGGATLQFAMIPMNLMASGKPAQYIVTGAWGEKALGEAKIVAGSAGAGSVSRTAANCCRLPNCSSASR